MISTRWSLLSVMEKVVIKNIFLPQARHPSSQETPEISETYYLNHIQVYMMCMRCLGPVLSTSLLVHKEKETLDSRDIDMTPLLPG